MPPTVTFSAAMMRARGPCSARTLRFQRVKGRTLKLKSSRFHGALLLFQCSRLRRWLPGRRARAVRWSAPTRGAGWPAAVRVRTPGPRCGPRSPLWPQWTSSDPMMLSIRAGSSRIWVPWSEGRRLSSMDCSSDGSIMITRRTPELTYWAARAGPRACRAASIEPFGIRRGLGLQQQGFVDAGQVIDGNLLRQQALQHPLHLSQGEHVRAPVHPPRRG